MNTERRYRLEKLLTEAGLRPTPVRLLIVRLLDEAPWPITSAEIEERLETVNRSSVTRTMSVFQKSGLVHVISDGTPSLKYELCREGHDARHGAGRFHGHNDEHVHFHCEVCGRTICLTDVEIPEVRLPEGLEARKVNFVITGVCSDCQTKE